jgi:hypothetical protein
MSAAIDHDARAGDITHGGSEGLHDSCDIVHGSDAFEWNGARDFFVEVSATAWHKGGINDTR